MPWSAHDHSVRRSLPAWAPSAKRIDFHLCRTKNLLLQLSVSTFHSFWIVLGHVHCVSVSNNAISGLFQLTFKKRVFKKCYDKHMKVYLNIINQINSYARF